MLGERGLAENLRCCLSGAAAMAPEALRAMLMAKRPQAPVPSASQPTAALVPAPGEEEARKREADAIDAPSAKRARTVSEPEAAANALLEEMAAEMPAEQAPTDDEALQGAQQEASGYAIHPALPCFAVRMLCTVANESARCFYRCQLSQGGCLIRRQRDRGGGRGV